MGALLGLLLALSAQTGPVVSTSPGRRVLPDAPPRRAAIPRPPGPGRSVRLQPSARPRVPRAPRTPEGLPPCESGLMPQGRLPRSTGETIRYHVEVDGLSVGTVDFKIERAGSFDGGAVTEYRSLFKLDSLVSTFVPVEGRAASLVPSAGFVPARAMNRYRLHDNAYEEEVSYAAAGRHISSKRRKNGLEREVVRTFDFPALDFISGFYLLRILPPDVDGCTIIYGNQRAYTVWIRADGQEKIDTPIGPLLTDRYAISYASEKSAQTRQGALWLARTADRIPYRAEIRGAHPLVARVHTFDMGAGPTPDAGR